MHQRARFLALGLGLLFWLSVGLPARTAEKESPGVRRHVPAELSLPAKGPTSAALADTCILASDYSGLPPRAARPATPAWLTTAAGRDRSIRTT